MQAPYRTGERPFIAQAAPYFCYAASCPGGARTSGIHSGNVIKLPLSMSSESTVQQWL